jgi:SAM-dependent methyltransferase
MVAPRLRKRARTYISGDLDAEFGPNRIDVCDLQFDEKTFDIVVCNHVLEHVPDDRRAMREIRRVLKPGGWAMLLVPDVHEATTSEDLNVTDPNERLRLYGQTDHVRTYGWDYVDRLSEAGLSTEVIRLGELLTPETIRLCRLVKFGEVEPLFIARPEI